MRLRLPPTSADAPRGSGTPTGPTPRRGDATPLPVFGGWSATRWQYSSHSQPGRLTDVVCDLGGSVTLSLSATAFILAFDVSGRGKHTVSGVCDVGGDELLLWPDGADAPQRLRFRQSGDTLALHSDSSGWDFDGTGTDQDATFVAVLVRL
jgi:hypothetical protein